MRLPALSAGSYDFYDDFHQDVPQGSIVASDRQVTTRPVPRLASRSAPTSLAMSDGIRKPALAALLALGVAALARNW